MLLAEKLLLLALDDEKGTVNFSAQTAYKYGIAGALLLELSVLERIDLQGKKINVVNQEPTGVPLLDTVMEVLLESKPRNITHWVMRLPGNRKLRLTEQLRAQLVSQGWIVEGKKKFLGLFPYSVYPSTEEGYRVEDSIRYQVRALVLDEEEKDEEDISTSLLISLIKACQLQNSLFDKDERKLAKRRINELVKNEKYGKAVSDTVQAIQASIIASVAAATAASNSSSN